MMLQLIPNQKKLLKLASGLQSELDSLVQDIKSHPHELNEATSSSFIDEILHFLSEAMNMAEAKKHQSLRIAHQHALIRLTNINHGPGPELQAGRRRSSAANRPFPHLTNRPTISAFTSIPLRMAQFSMRPPLATQNPNTNRKAWAPVDSINFTYRGLWLTNAPLDATPTQLSRQICGGPLEALIRFPNIGKGNSSYLIIFLHPGAAAAFMAFANTEMGKLHFPGKNQSHIEWSTQKTTIHPGAPNDAENLSNPPRRILLFHNYPGHIVDRSEVLHKLKSMEKKFLHKYTVDEYEVSSDGKEACMVFNMIEAAVAVMAHFNFGLLGPEFDACQIEFGKDVCDRPIPILNTVIQPHYTSAPRLAIASASSSTQEAPTETSAATHSTITASSPKGDRIQPSSGRWDWANKSFSDDST